MKQALIRELDRGVIDVQALTRLIVTGHKVGLFTKKFEALELFSNYQGKNIFQHMADKGVLSKILPIFLGPNLHSILTRENVAVEVFKIFVKTAFENMLLNNLNKGYSEDLVESFNLFVADKSLYQLHWPEIWGEITKKVQPLKSEPAKDSFTKLFQVHWNDILGAHNYVVQPKIMLLVSEIARMISHKDKEGKFKQDISLNDLANLLVEPKTFTDIEAVKQHIFQKCAEHFLADTLSQMVAEDLIDLKKIKTELGSLEKIGVKSTRLDVFIRLNDFGTLCSRSLASPTEEAVIVKTEDKYVAVVQEQVQQTEESIKTEDRASTVIQEEPQEQASSIAQKDALLPEVVQPLALTADVKEIKKYAKHITQAISQSGAYKATLVKDFGTDQVSGVSQLHIFISMLSKDPSFLEQTLQSLAQRLKKTPMNQKDFLTGYVDTLKASDFLTLCPKHNLNAFELACVTDQVDLASMLLNKGFNLKVYEEGNHSLFDAAFKHKAHEITKHLLTEQKLISIDWYHVLSLAMKYVNTDAVGYYISSGCEVQDIRDKNGNSEQEGSKYNILNKALLYLQSLVQPLSNSNLDQESKGNIITKMINSNKVYYAEDNKLVCTTTLSLLKSLKHVNKLPDSILEKSARDSLNHIRELIIEQYADFALWPGALQEINKLKGGNDDAQSETSDMTDQSCLTHYSILSDLDNKENVGPAGHILNKNDESVGHPPLGEVGIQHHE